MPRRAGAKDSPTRWTWARSDPAPVPDVRRGTGWFYDGENASRREVVVDVVPGGLRLLDRGDHREVAAWAYRALRPVDEVAREGRCRIRTDHGHARLVLTDRSLIAEIAAHAPQLAASGRSRVGLLARWAGLVVVSMAALLAVLGVGLPRFAEEIAEIVPTEWEMSFGESLVEPAVRQLAMLDTAVTPAWCTARRGHDVLEALTRRLAPAESPYRFQVRVASLDLVNAFALPGGQIVLTRGLLGFAESPDEVAGVLAHEMGHVVRRHTTSAVIEALGLAFLFGVMLGDPGTAVIGSAGEVLVGLGFRREAEMEADASAIALLERADVSTGGLADLFDRLGRRAGDMPEALHLLSTHPSDESRRELFERHATDRPPSLGAREWRELKDICTRRESIDLP